MKKYLLMGLSLVLVGALLSGCGTTVNETFDPVPNDVTSSAKGQTALPVASKIALQVISPNVTFTGQNNSVEAGAAVKVYNDVETLLASGQANNNGAFSLTFNNTLDGTFLLTATSAQKEESNSIIFQKM